MKPWQHDPHERRLVRFTQRLVSAVVLGLTLGLLALAADNFARCAVLSVRR